MFLIAIPHYNSTSFIEETINSLEYSSSYLTRVIVIDDGSTDNEKQALERIVQKSTLAIEIIWNSENCGLVAVRRMVWMDIVKIAKPKFFHFLDADDIVHPNLYQAVYHKLNGARIESNSVFRLPYKNFVDEPIFERTLNFYRNWKVIKHLDLGSHSRLIWCCLDWDFLEKVSFSYDSPYEDWNFYARIAPYFSCFGLQGNPAIAYRRSESSLSYRMMSIVLWKKKINQLKDSEFKVTFIFYKLFVAELKKFLRRCIT